MSDQCRDTLRCDPDDLQQAMSIHTRKITDSCRDKDCIEDLRVYLTPGSQAILDSAAGARVRNAELLYTYIDVEPVAFDRNHYCIDVTFYYQIQADAVTGAVQPASLYGLAVFTKRAILCGEDSRAHIFRSDTIIGGADGITRMRSNRPIAVVEVTDTNSQNIKPTHIHKPHLNATAFFMQLRSFLLGASNSYIIFRRYFHMPLFIDFSKTVFYNNYRKLKGGT